MDSDLRERLKLEKEARNAVYIDQFNERHPEAVWLTVEASVNGRGVEYEEAHALSQVWEYRECANGIRRDRQFAGWSVAVFAKNTKDNFGILSIDQMVYSDREAALSQLNEVVNAAHSSVEVAGVPALRRALAAVAG